MRRLFVFAALMLAGCGSGSDSESLPPAPVTCTIYIDWEPPKKRTGGQPITIEELAGYTIFLSLSEDLEAQQFSLILDVDDPALVRWRIQNISGGNHWVAMKVTDTDGETSAYSNIQEFFCQ